MSVLIIIDTKFKILLSFLESKLNQSALDMLKQLLEVGEYKVGVEFMVDYIADGKNDLPPSMKNELMRIKELFNIQQV